MNEKELVLKWLDNIIEMAGTRKTANGVVMSSEDTLNEIRVFAKDAKEYVNKFITNDHIKKKNEVERIIKTKECPKYNVGDVLMFEDGWSIKLYKMIGYEMQYDETMCKFEYIKLSKNYCTTTYKGFDKFFPYEIVDLGFKLVDSKLWDKAEELYSVYHTKFDEIDLKWKAEIAKTANEMLAEFKESMI